MTFYDGTQPFWIQRETEATTPGKCPCGKQIHVGDKIAIIEWEGPSDCWSRMHLSCAHHHAMNQANMAHLDLDLEQPWTFGTQRDCTVFAVNHPDVLCEYKYLPTAKWGKQMAYRISAHQNGDE